MGRIKAVTAMRGYLEERHDLLPFTAMGFDPLAEAPTGYDVCHLMRDGLIDEALSVAEQQGGVVADHTAAPWAEYHHTCGFADQIEADLRFAGGQIERGLRLTEQLPGFRDGLGLWV
jgi:hypothetical protein